MSNDVPEGFSIRVTEITRGKHDARAQLYSEILLENSGTCLADAPAVARREICPGGGVRVKKKFQRGSSILPSDRTKMQRRKTQNLIAARTISSSCDSSSIRVRLALSASASRSISRCVPRDIGILNRARRSVRRANSRAGSHSNPRTWRMQRMD